MKPTEIRLNPDDLKCLMRGGSIDWTFGDVTVTVSMKQEEGEPRFRQTAT